MTPITEEDIDDMRQRGFDPSVIEEAKARLCLLRQGEGIAEEIRHAFADVRLGDGIGLWEAQGLDDYADVKTMNEHVARDEREDWSAIPVTELQRCSSSLSFFDAEGMRFHLPAYLLAELRGLYGYGMTFCLTHLRDDGEQFALLNIAQRSAVRRFLLHILKDPDSEFEQSHIQSALGSFWR